MVLSGNNVWIQLGIKPGNPVPEISRIRLRGSLEYSGKSAPGWQFTCAGSDDGITLKELGKVSGTGLPGEERKNPFAALFGKPKEELREGEEWIYVDLGTPCTIDSIKLDWINKAVKGIVQVSEDATDWIDIASLPGNSELVYNVILKNQKRAAL